LTAAAVIVGARVILFHRIFQGLAIALMAGEVASLFTALLGLNLFPSSFTNWCPMITVPRKMRIGGSPKLS
jgi:hypothetical protein